jgi:hypothetical protein
MLSTATRRQGVVIRLFIAFLGVVILLLSGHLPGTFWGLPLQEVVRELATFLLAALLVHWIYDSYIRQEALQDIFNHVIGATEVSRSGITDFRQNSKSIDYKNLLRSRGIVVIGLHYSPRLIEDVYEQLKSRCELGLTTIILVSAPQGHAIEFLKTVRGEHGHVEANLTKIKALMQPLRRDSESAIQLYYHDQVLRYSFVLNDDLVWVKFYRNSTGPSNMPAIAIRSGTTLYDFFHGDVTSLVKEAMVRGSAYESR